MEKLNIVHWEGCIATDEKEQQYIDLTSGGIFAAILGPGAWEIKNAIAQPRYHCSYMGRFRCSWRDRYIGMLKELTGFESVALFSAGTEATEAFWRCCRIYTGKPGVWGGLLNPDDLGQEKPMMDQYHGMTLGAQIMAGRLTWQELNIYPELGEKRFGMSPEATSCMIMEPYHAPSAQFHKIHPTVERIRSLQKTYPDISLCLDEIQGGFGRTGRLWAHEHYQKNGKFLLNPDFITIGKMAGGGLPLSALLGPKDIMESEIVEAHGHLHSTHSGNPIAMVAGCAVIQQMEKQNLIEQARVKGAVLHDLLSKLPIKSHGKGLLAGLVLNDKAEAANVVDMCQQRGVLLIPTTDHPVGKWVKIGPALNIPEQLLEKAIKIVQEVVEEVVDGRETVS